MHGDYNIYAHMSRFAYVCAGASRIDLGMKG